MYALQPACASCDLAVCEMRPTEGIKVASTTAEHLKKARHELAHSRLNIYEHHRKLAAEVEAQRAAELALVNRPKDQTQKAG